jgi:hypothetical protein
MFVHSLSEKNLYIRLVGIFGAKTSMMAMTSAISVFLISWVARDSMQYFLIYFIFSA